MAGEVGCDRDLRLFAALLGFGSAHQGIEAALQPAEIEPGENRANGKPMAQGPWCESARIAAAVKPNRSVSQAMRRSVVAPATSSATLAILATTGEAADDFADTGVKAKTAENQHQPRRGVQPAVQKETDCAADDNRANESER